MEQNPKYPIGGYEPGNYTCKCYICGNEFQGDKRAVQCEPCAVKATQSPSAQSVEQNNIQEFYQEWCKKTKRSGGVLIGSSIKELLTDFANKINAASTTQGAVWVVASKGLPEVVDDSAEAFTGADKYYIDYRVGRQIKTTGIFAKDEDGAYCLLDQDGTVIRQPDFDRLLWLDETGSQRQAGPRWIKATRENMRRSAILRDQVVHENHIHQWHIKSWHEAGVTFTNGITKEWWELEILCESTTPSKESDAVEFAIWLSENNYWSSSANQWMNSHFAENYTTEQLYQLFKEKK